MRDTTRTRSSSIRSRPPWPPAWSGSRRVCGRCDEAPLAVPTSGAAGSPQLRLRRHPPTIAGAAAMRLSCLETGHEPREKAALAAEAAERGTEPPDVLKTLHYRPEGFGRPFSQALDLAMRGPSDWSAGERELFAAFVSSLNQCP